VETINVVAAIIERDGLVFSAHKPQAKQGVAAGWEFPGGKVEPGETGEDALRRELAEELGVRLSTIWLFDSVEHDYPEFHLHMDCYVCHLLPGESVELTEHDEGRWVGRDELSALEWLPADQKLAMTLGMYWDQVFASEHL
jgi:8-oxo-dGTP diphosphatase